MINFELNENKIICFVSNGPQNFSVVNIDSLVTNPDSSKFPE